MNKTITSLQNEKVKQWAKLKQKKYRDETNTFLIEGQHLIMEADQAGCVEYLLIEENTMNLWDQYDCYYVSQAILDKISHHVSSSKYIAICKYQAQKKLTDMQGNILVLDDVQDPGNVGTIIRSAYSFGFDAIVLSNQSADLYNEKVIQASQGAMFHISCIRHDLSFLKDSKMPIYASCLHEATPLQAVNFVTPCICIVGNEGNGIQQQYIDMASDKVYIEMQHFESLNVGIAASILMYYIQNS